MASDDLTKPETRSERSWKLSAVVGLAFLVLAVRLFDLQVLGVEEQRLQSERNRIRQEWIVAPRGLILDRYGNILADSRPSYTVLAVPREVLGNRFSLTLLSELLDMPVEEIRDRLGSGPRHLPRVLRHDVGFTQVARIAERDEELPGVSLDVTNVRSYPHGSLAGHVIGHVGEISEAEVTAQKHDGYRAGHFIGRLGLERQYEPQLRGIDGQRFLEVDVVGRVVERFSGRDPIPPRIGETLRLHLDLRLQAVAESLLVGWRGAICMMDVKSGGMRVMASGPSFDPNLFATGIDATDWNRLNTDDDKPMLNRTVQATYAPGSTFKMISFALTLDGHVKRYRERQDTPCFGGYTFGNRWFGCWEELGHGVLDLQGALIRSCDTYFYQIAEKVSVDDLAQFASSAGLGRATGIDLPQELKGNVPTSEWLDRRYGERRWTQGTVLNLIIGQGEYLVTPLQMVRYAGALANGGKLLVPRLVEWIEGESGERRPPPEGTVEEWDVTKRTLDLIRRDMGLVVSDSTGTGRGCRVPGYQPAAKTGTSENPHGAPHSWFIGYAPADDPEIAFSIVVEAGGHGSDTAVPMARRLLTELAGRREDTT